MIPETLRYYSNIVSTFSPFVIRGIDKLANLEIEIVAPSHGIIWRKDPSRVINLYKDYARYMNEPDSGTVTIVYSSMYGNSAKTYPTN